MILINYRYINVRDLQAFVKNNKFDDYNLLIQIFAAPNKEEFIRELLDNILFLLPNTKIIGMTTSGEIADEKVLEYSTILSFCQFEKTTITTHLELSSNNSFLMGQNIIESHLDILENTKVALCFTDGLHTNGEDFLNGISSIKEDLIVAGGMAGDYSRFEDTFVFTQDGITNNGAVIAFLENKDLEVFTEYSFNWESMGKAHVVTKSSKNRVYEIDDKTASEFYGYYLGEKIGKMLPAVGIEFPLILEKNGITIGRAAIEKHEDGSLSFAGNIPQGSFVKFGHGNISSILNKSIKSVQNLEAKPIEAIFIYSCMARKTLLGENINLEITPFNKIAPLCGSFTNGEFYHNSEETISNTKLLNETMTVLALSESSVPNQNSCIVPQKHLTKKDTIEINRIEALSHLISTTTLELEELTQNLEKRVAFEVEKNLEADKLLNIFQAQSQLGSMLEMIIHQWRQPLSAMSSVVSGLQMQNEYDLLSKDDIDQSSEKMLELINFTNQTIDDFRNIFSETTLCEDITAKELMKKTKNIFKSLLIKNNINILEEYNCKDGDKLHIPIGQMIQVLIVIIKNSVDALLENKIENPMIYINVSSQGTHCLIQIEDNGGGIPESIIENIFNYKFSTKKTTHGTGVGLDICKKIITKSIQGKIEAKNGDYGAIISIEIPVK